MSTEQNKTLIRRYFDLLGMRKIDEALALVTPDFIDHQVPPDMGAGLDASRKFYQDWFEGFPDGKMVIDDVIAEGDEVVVRGTFRGMNTGRFMDSPATRKLVSLAFIDIFCITDGRIQEHWSEMDTASMMQQMGLLQMPETMPAERNMKDMKDMKNRR